MAERALATAFVNIVPGTQQLETYLRTQLGSEASAAGAIAGTNLGGGMFANAKRFLGPIAAAFSIAAIGQFSRDLIRLGEEQVVAKNRIDAIADSMGLFGDQTTIVTGRINDYADALSAQTSVDDESIRAAQAKLLTFKDLAITADETGGAFDRATAAALDLAAAGFGSAEGNAKSLGRALQDPIKGLSMLGRQGVTFTGEQQELIKTLVEQGNLFEAQNIILGAVEEQVGGTAAATATATDQIKIGWENVVGDLGERVLPVFGKLADFLTTKVFPAIVPLVDKAIALGTAFFQSSTMISPFRLIFEQILALLPVLMPILSAIGQLAIQVFATLGPVLEQLVTTLVQALLPVLPTVAELITALTPVVLFLAAALAFLLPIFISIADFLLKILIGAINIVIGTIVFLANVFTAVFNGIAAIFTFFYEAIVKPIVDLFVREFERMGRTATALYKNFIEPVFKDIGAIFQWVWKTLIEPVINWAIGAFEAIGKTVSDVFGGIGKFIEDTFKNIVGFVRGPVNAIIDLVNRLIKALNSLPAIEIPDWVPLVGGTVLDFNIPLIPKLAKGGYVDQPTTALIGEAGPEVVTPLKDFERMMGIGNGSSKGTINYYAAPNQSLDAEQALFNAMKRAEVLAGW